MHVLAKNPILCLVPFVLVIALGSVIASLDAERGYRQQMQRAASVDAVNAQIENKNFRAESGLATTRYSSGSCTLSTVALQQGMKESSLQPGSAICDRHGNTAIVGDSGVLEKFAKTNDIGTIRRFLGW